MAIQRIQDFLTEVADIRAAQIRKEMADDIHVLVLNASQFSSLIKDHLQGIRRLANKTEDPDIKRQLLEGSNRQPYKLAIKLLKRFDQLLTEELMAQGASLKFKTLKQGQVKLFFIEKNPKLRQSVFRLLQEKVLGNLRKTLVFNSKPGSIERALSIVIAGIDIDTDNVTDSTPLGTFAKSKVVAGAPLTKREKSDPKKGIKAGDILPVAGAGIQLGHFRGGATAAASKKIEIIKKYQSNIVKSTGLFLQAKGQHDIIHSYDAEVRFNDIIYGIAHGITGAVDISIIGLEQTAKNALSGSLTTSALKEFDKWLKANAEAIVTAKGSKPIVNQIMDDYEKMFTTGKNPKSKRVNKRLKKRKTVKHKVPVSTVGFKTQTNIGGLGGLLGLDDTTSINTQEIITLINRRLHDQIKENMGKGQSKKILNYRTGRFARSAKLQALFPSTEKNAINAQVRYMRNPYKVFEPGGRLALPGRDPHRIFGRSIRQILQEEKIANLRRVKVVLRG